MRYFRAVMMGLVAANTGMLKGCVEAGLHIPEMEEGYDLQRDC
jgi:hypothetical protein